MSYISYILNIYTEFLTKYIFVIVRRGIIYIYIFVFEFCIGERVCVKQACVNVRVRISNNFNSFAINHTEQAF